jgi:hypothetical protein
METLKEYHKCSVMSDKMELIAPSMPPTPAPWRKTNEPGHLWFAVCRNLRVFLVTDERTETTTYAPFMKMFYM